MPKFLIKASSEGSTPHTTHFVRCVALTPMPQRFLDKARSERDKLGMAGFAGRPEPDSSSFVSIRG